MTLGTLTSPTIDSRASCRRAIAPVATRRTIAGRYDVGPRIGQGGMGEVFLARDLVLGRDVAIKQSRARVAGGQHLRREARIASRIAHPAVVRIYDLVADGGADHLVMDLIDGPALSTLHARGRVPPADVVQLARALAGALDAVHQRGAIHLDVKIENVLFTADGQPTLIDFGIARCAGEVGVEHELVLDAGHAALVGTPRVMSPEQIQGDLVDARSDLYSLGVLMFELLAGGSLFAAGNDVDTTLARVLGEPPPRLEVLVPEAPAPLAALVGDLLEKAPALRPQSAREVHARLRAP